MMMMTGPSPSPTPIRIDPSVRNPGSRAPPALQTRAVISEAEAKTARQVQIHPGRGEEIIRSGHPTRCSHHRANDAVTLSP